MTPATPRKFRGGATQLPEPVNELPSADASPAPAPAPSSSSSSRPQVGQALGGLIVGLYLWGFAENWIRGGSAQAWAWAKSKFMNETTGGAPASSAPKPNTNAAVA